MMPEPTSAVLAAIAGLSAITLALFGVDYHSLVYALCGAMFSLFLSGQMTWGRAVVYVLLSTIVGAVLGNLAAAYITGKPPKIVLIALCLLCGFMAQAIAQAMQRTAPVLADILVKWLERLLRRLTGDKP